MKATHRNTAKQFRAFLRASGRSLSWLAHFCLIEVLIYSIVFLPLAQQSQAAFTDPDGNFTIWAEAGRANHFFSIHDQNSPNCFPGGVLTTPGGAKISGSYPGAPNGMFLRDETTNEFVPLPDDANGSVTIPPGAWSNGNGSSPHTLHFTVEGRGANSLAIVQNGTTYPATCVSGSWAPGFYTDGGSWVESGVDTFTATFDPTMPFRIVDLSTNEQFTEGQTFAVNTGWEPIPAPLPLEELRVVLPAFAAGQNFTVQSQVSGGPITHQAATAVGYAYWSDWSINGSGYFYVDSCAVLTLTAPVGGAFWITNDRGDTWPLGGGNHTVPEHSTAIYSFDALDFPVPPPPPSVAVTLRISAETFYNSQLMNSDSLANHQWQLWTSAGMIAESNPSYSINTFTGGSSETITTHEGQTIDNPISVFTFTAQVPVGVDWWAYDYSTGQVMPIGQADFLNGWIPHIPLPGVASSLDIHAERLTPQGYYTGYISVGIAPPSFQSTHDTSSVRWISGLMLNGAGPAGTVTQYDREFWNEDTYESYTLPYTHLEYEVPGDWGSSYVLVIQNDMYALYYQNYIGEEISLPVGPVDDTIWRPAPQPIYLNISESRWGHNLVLRQVDGTEYPIFPGQTQGDTSWNPNSAQHLSWQNSYYYFDANTQATPGIPWRVVDKTANEEAGDGETDHIQWIYVTPPFLEYIGYSGVLGEFEVNFYPASAGAASFSIERKTPDRPLQWEEIARFANPAEQAWTACRFTDTTAQFLRGGTVGYRMRAHFGGKSSAYSEDVGRVFTAADSDGDGITDAWELAYGLNPNVADSLRVLRDGSSTAFELFESGYTPTVADTTVSGGGGSRPATSADWDGVKRVALRSGYGGYGENDDGDIVGYDFLEWPSDVGVGSLTIQREVGEGVWESVATEDTEIGEAYIEEMTWEQWSAIFERDGSVPGDGRNYRLSGSITSNESVMRIKVHTLNAMTTRVQPGFQAPDGSPIFYKVRTLQSYGWSPGGGGGTDYYGSEVETLDFSTRKSTIEFEWGYETWHSRPGLGGSTLSGFGYGNTNGKLIVTWSAPPTLSDRTQQTFAGGQEESCHHYYASTDDRYSTSWVKYREKELFVSPTQTKATYSFPPETVSALSRLDYFHATTAGLEVNRIKEGPPPLAKPNPLPELERHAFVHGMTQPFFVSPHLYLGSEPWLVFDTITSTPSSIVYERDDTDGYSETKEVTYTDEYSVGNFMLDTRPFIPPYPLPGADAETVGNAHLGQKIGQNRLDTWVAKQEANFSSGYDLYDFTTHQLYVPLSARKLGRRIGDSDIAELSRAKYWIECNDCLPEKPMTFLEIRETYDINGNRLSQTVVKEHTITPGSKPGLAIRVPENPTDYLESDVTDTGYSYSYLLQVVSEFVKVDTNGSIGDAPFATDISAPSPVIALSNLNVQNIHTNAQGQLVGDVTIAGTVTSDLCDTLPGPDGMIDEVYLSVNGRDIGGNRRMFAPIPVTGEKSVDLRIYGEYSVAYGKAFPFMGTFSQTISNVPLSEGQNVIKVWGKDKVYQLPGSTEYAAFISGVSFPTGQNVTTVNLGATIASAGARSDTSMEQFTLRFTKADGSVAQVGMTETSLDSNLFTGQDGTTTLTVTPAVAASQPLRAFALSFADSQMHSTESGIILYEGEGRDGNFTVTQGSDDHGDGGDTQNQTTHYRLRNTWILNQTIGGSFAPGAHRIRGLFPWIPHSAVNLHDLPGLTGVYSSFGGDYYLSRAVEGMVDTFTPIIFSARLGKGRELNTGEVDAFVRHMVKGVQSSAKYLNWAVRFEVGFSAGLAAGGVELVTGVVSSVGSAFTVAGNLTLEGIGYISIYGSKALNILPYFDIKTSDTRAYMNQLRQERRDITEPIVDAVSAARDVLVAELTPWVELALLSDSHEDMQRVHDELDRLGDIHEIVFNTVTEVLSGLAEDFANLPPEKQGYYTGRVTFEVGTIILAYTKISKIDMLARVSQAQVFTKFLAQAKWMRESFPRAAARIGDRIIEISTTKGCFVAGTVVWTLEGKRAIEELRAGDMVWARDEVSGREGYKPVVEAIITNPDVLCHVRFAALSRHAGRGDPAGEEVVSCTAGHPFYVTSGDEPGFVAASELQPGAIVARARGGKAVVVAVEAAQAAVGGEFTTYNIEVEGYHTYFVGEAGLWVHNEAMEACKWAMAMVHNLYRRHGDIWQAFTAASGRRVLKKLADLPALKIFNECRALYFQNTHPGSPNGTSGIWHRLADQVRGLAGSSATLGKNLQKIGIRAPWGEGNAGNGLLSAHHIVPWGDNRIPEAQLARDILLRAEIDINEAANGVFLPRQGGHPDLGTLHSGGHTTSYVESVYERLRRAEIDGRNIRNELQSIADDLVNHRLRVQNPQ